MSERVRKPKKARANDLHSKIKPDFTAHNLFLLAGSEKEKTVLMPQTKEYNVFGQDCVSVGCSVDLFLFNNAYIDVATLSQVSRLTGGQVYKYTYFNKDIDAERMLNDLRNNLSRPVAFDAIMRVRTSTGIRYV